MKISDWLDAQEADNQDITTIEVPKTMFYKEDPDETLYYQEIQPCGLFCTKDHPFATVVRYGHWFYARGRDKDQGTHSSQPEWRMFTRDKELAIQTARSHIEND
ncbi:MAG TPA: hypothetical protein VJ969_10575 [Desulfopila sp.]|nr:hypothetical protein [Desulfopila sp.]